MIAMTDHITPLWFIQKVMFMIIMMMVNYVC